MMGISCNNGESERCSNNYQLVKIIEAEDCHLVKECSKNGDWQEPWPDSKFSGNALIHNQVAENKGGNATLTLKFMGIGVAIVYRQDVWYGSLSVKIDNNSVDDNLIQRGEEQNQVERCFIANEESEHTLTLMTSDKTGVITIDAIKILKRK